MPDFGMTLVATDVQHAVHFYEREETLAEAVADFLGAGLASGGTALVVATPSHSRAFANALSCAGIDIAEARKHQLYIDLDAEDLLSRFLVDGHADPQLFDSAIRPLMALGKVGAQPMRVYGEMVDLLWQAGNVSGAHDTEMLWNTLGAGGRFALLCGYASSCVATKGPDRQAIASRHEAVLARPATLARCGDASRRFEPTLFAPSAARQFACEVLRSWRDERRIPEAELVVSELATNAVVHAGGRFTVGLTRVDGDRLKIEISDGSRLVPETNSETSVYATNGRGIRIVSAIAQRWGVSLQDGGKTVWAELAARSAL